MKFLRKFSFIFAVCMTLCLMSADAFAIDGYKSRRGFFGGFGVGGGAGQVGLDALNIHTGFNDTRQMGWHLSGILGGGASERLLFGGELNWWIRTLHHDSESLNHQHLSLSGVTNFFLLSGFYLDAGVGLAYARFDAWSDEQSRRRYRETGLAVKAGLGFDYFVNGTVATGINFGYIRHFYQNSNFDTLKGGLTVRWY